MTRSRARLASRASATVLVAAIMAFGLPLQARAATSPLVVAAEADALVAQASGDTNFGSDPMLGADNHPVVRSLLRFTVSGVTGSVTRARLRLYVTDGSGNGPEIWAAGSGWSESGVTWNNQPGLGAAALADVGSVSSKRYVEWDVTGAVTGDGPYNFAVVADSTDGSDFASREASANRPELLVEFGSGEESPPPPPPPPPGDGVISTVAGSGSGFAGDGGPATAARLRAPRTMAVDSAGNIYIVDTDNHRVRKVDTSGVITTIAGTGTAGYSGDGGPATSARLNTPHGIAVDSAGNVYVGDPPNQRIRKIDTSGRITSVAGTGTAGYNGDNQPATSARINYPKGVEIGPDGLLYIADANNDRIRRVSASGIISTVAGTGSAGLSGDGGPALSARLNTPRNMAFDGSGNMYIADDNNCRVRRVNSAGTISTVAGSSCGYGGDGGSATSARMGRVRDVAVDGSGNVYIADEENDRVRRVSTGGTMTTFAGTGTAGLSGDGGLADAARISGPRGVAADFSGRILIGDTGNHRIRRVG